METKQNQKSIWVAIMVVVIGFSTAVLAQQKQIRTLEMRIADLESSTHDLHGYVWDITFELTGSPLNAKDFYAYGNEVSGLSRIDKLYAEIWGERVDRESWDKNFEECGHQATKPGCPDSRIDINSRELFEEPFIKDQDTTQSDYSRIDALWQHDILALFGMYNNLHKAFCDIEPEYYPLCVQ